MEKPIKLITVGIVAFEKGSWHTGPTKYTIRSETFRGDDSKAFVHHVDRRYMDFYELVKAFRRELPGFVIPPLPGTCALGRFEEELIETRKEKLEVFLREIIKYEELRNLPVFTKFLQTSISDLPTQLSEAEIADQMEMMMSDLARWEKKIARVIRWAEALVKVMHSLSKTSLGFSQSFVNLSKVEVEEFGSSFEKVGNSFEEESRSNNEELSVLKDALLGPLLSQQGLMQSIRDAMQDCNEKKAAFHKAEQLSEASSIANKDANAATSAAVIAAKAEYETAAERLRKGYKMFVLKKETELRCALQQLIESQLALHRKGIQTWSALSSTADPMSFLFAAGAEGADVSGLRDGAAPAAAPNTSCSSKSCSPLPPFSPYTKELRVAYEKIAELEERNELLCKEMKEAKKLNTDLANREEHLQSQLQDSDEALKQLDAQKNQLQIDLDTVNAVKLNLQANIDDLIVRNNALNGVENENRNMRNQLTQAETGREKLESKIREQTRTLRVQEGQLHAHTTKLQGQTTELRRARELVNILEGDAETVNALNLEECNRAEVVLKGTMTRLEQRQRILQDNFCVVCHERPKKVVLFPCRHRCLCQDPRCNTLTACPMCRDLIVSRTSVFG